jgi:hypothetical protein
MTHIQERHRLCGVEENKMERNNEKIKHHERGSEPLSETHYPESTVAIVETLQLQ